MFDIPSDLLPDIAEETSDMPIDEDNRISEANPGDDIPVAEYDSLTVIDAVKQYMEEAEKSKEFRDELDMQNWDAFHGRSRSNEKVDGQSNEFIPKVSLALEQIAADIKKGLVSFGNYFDVTLTPDPVITGSPLTASGIVKLMRRRLEDPDEIITGCTDFPTTIEDGIKTAALSSLLILKVHGVWDTTRAYDVEVTKVYDTYDVPTSEHTSINVASTKPRYQKEDLVLIETKVWRLVIELVNPKDFFIDPTGRGLYHIHRTYKDLYQVVDAADSGEYDKEAVKELARSCYRDLVDESDLEDQTNQPRKGTLDFRHQVELLEMWGTLLDSDGGIAHRNCRCVIANREYLILRPEDNPNAHGDHPFVYSPLVRVPFTTLHKGLFDQAVAFNLLLNDMFNLAADGALGASWGVNVVRKGPILNLDMYQDCIPPGATLIVGDDVDVDKIFKNIKTGGVSPETISMMNFTEQQFNAAVHTSDTKLGTLPKKTQSATGIAAADESTDTHIGSIIFNLEQNVMKPALKKAWLVMLQNCDDWLASDVVGCIGEDAAKMLAAMSPARRFANYAMGSRFKVDGLSSLLARGQEFQKLGLLQQMLTTNPLMGQAFMKKYSLDKLLQRFFKCTNMDPEDLMLTQEEKAAVEGDIARAQQLAGVMSPQGGAAAPQGAVNQQPGNPLSGGESAIHSMTQAPQTL